MKTKRLKTVLLAIAGIGFAATSTMAAITATSNDFSGGIGTWVHVGSVTDGGILHAATSEKDWYDGDDAVYIAAYAVGMDITGDGLLNDGGLRLDTFNAIPNDEAMGLTIGGTMELDEAITFSGNWYNDNTSYTKVTAQLWNLTDDVLLEDSGDILVRDYKHITYSPVDFSVSYTALASDVGDTLQIRFLDSGNTATVRDIYVDNFELSSVPLEAGTTKLIWDFNDGPTGTILTNDLANYDYTSHQEYDGSNAVVNTLAFNGKSGSTDYIIREKGDGHVSALYLKTLNPSANDFGIYLQKLDFTLGGQNSTNITRVSWSFDILGYDQSYGGTEDIIPTDWTVSISPDNEDPGINISDSWFSNSTVQTFSFSDDTTGETALNGTWTTVTGSYDIAVGAAGSLGGIQIRQPLGVGGYTSSGGIFLDNIEITITSAEPVLSEMFDDWIAGYGLTNSPASDPGTDYDGDLLSNLDEYGLGGNPTNAADTGYTPVTYPEAGDWLVYIYPQRHDAALAGLNYSTELTDDLVTGTWVGTGIEELDTGIDGFGSGFDAVTNRISTATKAKQFIQLQIDGL